MLKMMINLMILQSIGMILRQSIGTSIIWIYLLRASNREEVLVFQPLVTKERLMLSRWPSVPRWLPKLDLRSQVFIGMVKMLIKRTMRLLVQELHCLLVSCTLMIWLATANSRKDRLIQLISS